MYDGHEMSERTLAILAPTDYPHMIVAVLPRPHSFYGRQEYLDHRLEANAVTESFLDRLELIVGKDNAMTYGADQVHVFVEQPSDWQHCFAPLLRQLAIEVGLGDSTDFEQLFYNTGTYNGLVIRQDVPPRPRTLEALLSLMTDRATLG
jgi:hypothetical protein